MARYDKLFEGLETGTQAELIKAVKEVIGYLDQRLTAERGNWENCAASPTGQHDENSCRESLVSAWGGAPEHKHQTYKCKHCGREHDENCGYLTCA